MENDRIASEPVSPLKTEAKGSAVPGWMAGWDVARRARKWIYLGVGVARSQPPVYPPPCIRRVPAIPRGFMKTTGLSPDHLSQPAAGQPAQDAYRMGPSAHSCNRAE